MKKPISSVFLCILVSISFFMNLKSVHANEFIAETPAPFENMYVVNEQTGHKSLLGYLYVNNELVYCIEPFKLVNNGAALIPSGNLSNETREALSIISFMGYSNSRKSEKWYAATQIMIWEALGYKQTVHGFDDYETYKQQIQTGIKNFHKLPSFMNQLFTLKKGVPKVIKDVNKVLPLFKEVSVDNKNLKIERNGENLILTSNSNQKDNGEITIRKFNEASLGLAIVYVGKDDANTQAMIRTQLSKNIKGLFRFNIQSYGNLVLIKRGEVIDRIEKEETNFGEKFTIKFSEDDLSDVLVDLYAREDIVDANNKIVYKKNEFIETLVSRAPEVSSRDLISGKYYLKERKALESYVLDDKEYDFIIKDNTVEFDKPVKKLINKRSKIEVKIQKTMEKHPFLDLSDAYKDVYFGIYNIKEIYDKSEKLLVPKNSLVYSSKISKDGRLEEIVDLPLGSYYLKELSTNENYVVNVNKYPFELVGNNRETIEIEIDKDTMENKLIRSKLKIFKIDDTSKKPLQATFILYDQNMKQIRTFDTQANGEVILHKLVNGAYFIQEKEAPKGYKLNPLLYKVEINGKDIELKLENKKEMKDIVTVNTSDSSHIRKFALISLTTFVLFFSTIIKRVLKK